MPAWRLGVLITGLVCLVAWVAQRVELVLGGPYIAGGTGPDLALAALPLGILGLSALASRWLRRGDRAVLYAAVAVGTTAVASGLAHRFLPGLVTGFYGSFANPRGPYRPLLEQVPSWLVPDGFASGAAAEAFEGAAVVPWGAWIIPLAAWAAFLLVFFATAFCLVWLLRRRWLTTEKLAFPLLEVPLALLGGESLANRVFWAGVAVPVLLFGINGLHHYWPALGPIETSLSFSHFLLEQPWKAMTPFESPFFFEVVPALVGLAYLMPVEVSFSTWFFFLSTRLQLLLAHSLGRLEDRGSLMPGHGSPWLDWPGHFPFFMSQARGGYLFLALASLWAARRGLRAEIHWRNPAVWGLVLGFLALWTWVMAAGLPPLLGLGALVLYFVASLGLARLRLDGGLPIAGVPLIVGYIFFVAWGTGPGVFADSTYIAFAFLGVLGFTAVGLWPTLQLEGLHLAQVCQVSPGRLVWAMGLAAVVGIGAGFYFSLETIYEHGLFALQEQGGARSQARIGRYYNYLLKDAATVEGHTDWLRLTFHALGAGCTYILAIMRRLFLHWPFHPMGFVYGVGFGWMVWGSALVGWLCKWLVVRYGGATTYRQVRPFFLGLIWGEIGMRLWWAGVAWWRGEMGGGYGM